MFICYFELGKILFWLLNIDQIKKKKKTKNQKPKTKMWLCMAIDWKIKTKQKGGWPMNDMQ